MGKKIGIDIGTMYTKICELDSNDRIEAVVVDIASKVPQIPSLVVKDGAGSYAGFVAEERMFYSDAQVFSGFKMLLAEHSESELLKAMGYSSENSPEKIMEYYINEIVDLYKSNCTENGDLHEIEKIVFCTPLIWNQAKSIASNLGALVDATSIDIKPKIYDICERVFNRHSKIDIEVVDEPGAACAYYAHEYNINNESKFNGYYLVIDYGGGTLDIALCKVETLANGNVPLVTPIATEGDGINTTGRTGTAGLAYLQDVIDKSIDKAKSKMSDKSTLVQGYQASKMASVKALEKYLIREEGRLRENLGAELFTAEDDVFKTITYNGIPMDITYGDLYASFEEMIKPVLSEKLTTIMNFMISQKIDFESNPQCFRIAMVGGFCNFILTRNSIAEILGLPNNSDHFKISFRPSHQSNRNTTEGDRSLAVARGACLIANEKVKYDLPAQWSIGIAHYNDRDQQKVPVFAFRKGDVIKYDQVYYILSNSKKEKRLYSGTIIMDFAFEFKTNGPILIKSPAREHQHLFELGSGRLFHIGFKMDKRGRLSIVIELLNKNDDNVIDETPVHTFQSIDRLLAPENAILSLDED